jgi:hypothetical protein
VDTGSTRICVVSRSDGGWDVRETATGPVLAGPTTRSAAMLRATAMLEGARGGRVVVLDPDGTVLRTLTIDPPASHPRWYLPAGWLRWVVPLGFGVGLVLRALAWEREASHVVLTVGYLAAFVGSLVLVLRSRALDRSRVPLEDAG